MSRMKLYYAPAACSLADHIALHEIGDPFDIERVNIRTHKTDSGIDFRTVSAKGYVPALILADGQMLTESIAVLDYLATLHPHLAPSGPLGRSRLLEALAFISTELHRAFKPMWHGGTEAERARAGETVTDLLDLMCDGMNGPFLFGDQLTVADFYLFVMLEWAKRFDVAVPQAMAQLREQMRERPAVIAALRTEGLL